MSYNSKLLQTGRRVANARRKYYGSFDYGSGIDAKLRGGTFSFGKKFFGGSYKGPLNQGSYYDWGTDTYDEKWLNENFGDDWVYEPDTNAAIRAYWNAHPREYMLNRGIASSILDEWEKQQTNGGQKFSDSIYDRPEDTDNKDTNFGKGWWQLAGIGLGAASNFMNMDEKRRAMQKKYDAFGTTTFNGLTDNNALLSTMANTPVLGPASTKDFRDKSVGQDILSVLGTGVSTTVGSGGNYWLGLAAMGAKTAQVLGERWNAGRLAKEASMEAKHKNLQFLKDMSVASQDVDARNDWMRMLGYYNDPILSAFGGPLHSNGGDYNGGLTYINEGGRHEENPYEGVPSGFDEEGNPNLVEEGEVVWNNEYVFSDRLKVPKELANKYKLGGKKDYTFAEAIEKLTKENNISPNDFITIATTKEIVNEFMDAQEAIREENQIAAREELEAAQAQDFLAQLNAAQGMAPAMGAPIDMGQMGALPNEAPVTEGPMMPPGYAFGGNKFEGGGWEDFFKMLEEYRGSLGASNASGKYAIDKNAKYWNNRSAVDIQNGADYQAFTKWVKEHKDDPNVQRYFEYLDKGINKTKGAKTLLKYDKDGKVTGFADDWEKTFEHRRTDDALGIYHLNPAGIGFLSRKQPVSVKVPDVALKDFDYNIPFDLDAYLASSSSATKSDTGVSSGVSQPQFEYRPTWQRYAPVVGSAMATLYGMLNRPDYSNADRIIEAAYRMGTPINIPVETIGDYRRRNPFDERYLVNMANQNRAAAARGIANTAGGNRSMDLLGNMSFAHSNQQELGEIMRQAYLANRQDDAQVAEFNRGTNLYNMNAINQRNLSQAQLNTHRQQAGLSGLERGYTMSQGIKDNWDDFTTESFESTLASLGAIGKENEEYNILTSMAEQGYFPWYYGDRSILQYIPQKTSKGGKLNRKKRRF